MCRKAAGAPYIAFLTLPRTQLSFTVAVPAIYRSSARAQRGFCAKCGTALLYDDGTNIIDVASATLGTPDYAPPMDQIYHAEAVSWADGVPGLPSYLVPRSG